MRTLATSREALPGRARHFVRADFLNPRRRAEDCPPYQFHYDRRVGCSGKKSARGKFRGRFEF